LLKVYDLYEDDDAFFIVTDLYEGGDFFDVLEDQGPLKEDDAAIVMNNLLNCVNYCHKRNVSESCRVCVSVCLSVCVFDQSKRTYRDIHSIRWCLPSFRIYIYLPQLVHRDLKPENILMSDRKRDFSDIKVIDFGLARYVRHADDTLKGLAGSAYYLAPQVISGPYTSKCDIWSCGVIAYALLTGFAPFDASTDAEVLKVVHAGEFDFDDPEWDHVSEAAMDFISQCLAYEEDDRPSAEQALQHPWLRKCRKSPRMNNALVRSASRSSLRSLTNFTSKSNKLKQAACAMISSQLLRREEKEIIDKAFRALDRGCNGTISKSDLNSSMTDLFKDSESENSGSGDDDSDDDSIADDNSHAKLIDEIFDEVNFSGTGAIQYSEFAIVTMLEKDMVDEGKLKAAFKFFDLAGKGYISKEDLKIVIKVGNHAAKKIMEQTADPGSDKITFKNFKKCILPNPNRERKDDKASDADRCVPIKQVVAENKAGKRKARLPRATSNDVPSIGRMISYNKEQEEEL